MLLLVQRGVVLKSGDLISTKAINAAIIEICTHQDNSLYAIVFMCQIFCLHKSAITNAFGFQSSKLTYIQSHWLTTVIYDRYSSIVSRWLEHHIRVTRLQDDHKGLHLLHFIIIQDCYVNTPSIVSYWSDRKLQWRLYVKVLTSWNRIEELVYILIHTYTQILLANISKENL